MYCNINYFICEKYVCKRDLLKAFISFYFLFDSSSFFLKINIQKVLFVLSFHMFGDQRRHTERRYVLNIRKFHGRKYIHD